MSITRVNYFDRQFLRPQDFSDEQAYHLAMHRAHNIGAHIWGILYGLEVVKDPVGNLAVQPGFAVDGYGRELVLRYPQTINPRIFDEKGSERLEVWLKYARLESDFTTGSYAGCNVEQGAPTRVQEMAEVTLQPPDPNLFVENASGLPERRQPPGVPANDLFFDPTRVPPDDPVKSWPVYLGLLKRVPGTPPTVTIDLSGRPYAGLVGEMVRSPSGRAWMQVGSELKEDPYRFAVYIPDVETQPAGTFSSGLMPRLGITTDGEIQLRGDTLLNGNLTVDGGSIEFGVGPAQSQQRRPWTISHVREREDPGNPDSSFTHQLRIEMGTPSDGSAPAGNNKVSIGAWSAKKNHFVPCLTVDDQCIVTVHGNLHVEGQLNAMNMSGQSSISPEARANSAGMMMMSLSQTLNSQTAARLNLETELRSAAASIEPIVTEAAATDIQPRLDDAMMEVIQVLRDNSLLPRFMTLLGGEETSEARMEEAVMPEVAAEEPAPSPEPAEPHDETLAEEEKPKTRTRSRKKKTE